MKDNSQHIFSDWSEIASYGKDAKVFTPYTKESLAPPVITGLDYYPDEFNSYPQIACTLEVPEELAKNLTTIQANGGGISIEWEAKLLGTDDWVGLQGDWLIKSGHCIQNKFCESSFTEPSNETTRKPTYTVLYFVARLSHRRSISP